MMLVHRFSISSLFCLILGNAIAQTAPLDNRAAIDQFELPDFTTMPADVDRLLPAIDIPSDRDVPTLYAGETFVLRDIQLSGNSLFSDAELNSLLKPYINQIISLPDLQQLRDRMTRFYVQQGYINSGAVLPNQTINNGIVRMQIIEGRLDAVQVQTDGRFKSEYFAKRLMRAAQPRVNIKKLQQRLHVFQQDTRIKRISAELKPSLTPGLATLLVNVQEDKAINAQAEFNNHHAPAIGAEGFSLNWQHTNLAGKGQTLSLGIDASEGLHSIDAFYKTPLNAADQVLAVFAKASQSDVIEGQFEDLNIESRARTVGVSFTQAISQTQSHNANWFLSSEFRKSESLLLGEGFSFSAGPEDGISRLSVLRGGIDWQSRAPRRVLAGRVTLNVGIDAFGATIHDDERPDGEFVSLLLQGQWAQRLSLWQSTFIARFDLQWSDSPLLGLEQFALGGHNTVRAYRENSLVRDQGVVAAIEWRLPYSKNKQHALAVFADSGYADNVERPTTGTTTISSLGVGLIGRFNQQWRYQLYWGEALKELNPLGESNLQDDGVHFQLGYDW